MNCPNCGAVMRERDRSGVKVDFCPNCKGVWLDRGELDKIISIELEDDDYDGHAIEARNAENARAASRDDDDDDREYRERYRDERGRKSKKSSFFESLTEMIGGE